MARREVCFLEKGSLAGKLASKKYDIIIVQALSKLREVIDVLKIEFFIGYRADVINYTSSSKLAVSYV